jgi:hypothetical protein
MYHDDQALYHGSCHCGAVRFEAGTALRPASRCHCSLLEAE